MACVRSRESQLSEILDVESMSRQKPQQELYRPGSGPLRKSQACAEDPEAEPKPRAFERFRAEGSLPRSINSKLEQRERPRKPEQIYYVPQPVAQAKDMDSERCINGNEVHRSKRYSNRRRGLDNSEYQDDRDKRGVRQGSEPRGVYNGNGWQGRQRDTRSVEPGVATRAFSTAEKIQAKPPSGRRHSTIGLESDRRKIINLESLPPRLQKKFLEKNKVAEEHWDGSSLTFQGSSGYPKTNYNVGNYATLPSHVNNQVINQGYHTLPNRPRGRGRLNQEYVQPPGEPFRSVTPDRHRSPVTSRPPTPPLHSKRDSRPQTPRNEKYSFARPDDTYERQRERNRRKPREDRRSKKETSYRSVEDQKINEKEESVSSTVSVETVREKLQQLPVFDTILDWSEEVELCDRLEQEALSDALTRSSSITSLAEIKGQNEGPKRSKKKSRKRSKKREGSLSRNRQRQNSCTSNDGRGEGRRRKSRDRRDKSFERFGRSREGSFDRDRNRRGNSQENWREEIIRSRNNSEREIDVKKPGVLVIPQESPTKAEQPKYPEITSRKAQGAQKILFDPNNPSKPIIVKSPNSSRVSVPGFSESSEAQPPQMYTTDQFGNIRPTWYNETSSTFKSCKYPTLIKDIKRADTELQYIVNSGLLLVNWDLVENLRQFLKEALEYLLCKDLKFCQTENVEQHMWKILYYNIIELTRKSITTDPDNKEHYKKFLLCFIDEGSKYFERLLEVLEETYGFKLVNFLGNAALGPQKGLGFIGLALVSAQKLFLFLGDLGRYREQVNETTNYGKCRQWYVKSHEINPKNGKPYNQLALLAIYSRRKLDAVYYYMRSLMSSNPVPSARESLISLFDENRKKYEQGEKKRREERQERARQQMKQKESEESNCTPGSLRKETWIRPDGGKCVHRTMQALQELKDSEEEDLASLSNVEVNKRFVTSYLHVHGKLITRIGMESFQEAAMQMLKEFRALLQHTPVPLPSNRFLQLLALNMFAIESTQLKDLTLQEASGYRSEFQERALVVSLQMFNLILERCVSILEEHFSTQPDNLNQLPQDAHVLLSAIKVWCDWMLCHSNVWNPPPSTQDFKVGSAGDAWSRMATLMNLLEKLDRSVAELFVKEPAPDLEAVRLPEDGVLCGFTPLMYNVMEVVYVPKEVDMEEAQFALRLDKLIFFGTVFLCGLEPPVLKLEIEDDFREYVSVVCTSNSRDSPRTAQELVDEEMVLESFSSDEEEFHDSNDFVDASSEVRDLLNRKVELEKQHRSQEQHIQRVKKILSQSVVSVHVEVRPKYLVPDTNCFIDHLERIATLAHAQAYTLKVPIIVLSELEGLARGGKAPTPETRKALDPQHVLKVAEAANQALVFLKSRHQNVKCVTTKGAVLTSSTFTTEDDSGLDGNLKNDDKILMTCLALCKGHREEDKEEMAPRKILREVVLLTDDRNLRVKAHARDVPVRELPDFMKWAGLG